VDLRVGSYAGIAGALLGLTCKLLHPATPSGTPKASPQHPGCLQLVLELAQGGGSMAVSVRYIVDDVDAAIAFYTE
jgi:hypothetical protein